MRRLLVLGSTLALLASAAGDSAASPRPGTRRGRAAMKTRRVVGAEAQRSRAGRAAAALVKDGDVVGLGTGRTAQAFIQALARRVTREGIAVEGVPTSVRTEALARSLGIPIASRRVRRIDIAVDGADEVDPGFNLVKGLGGALLREKRVARKARRFVVVVDSEKLVPSLGAGKIPVEIRRRGSDATVRALARLGVRAELRRTDEGLAFLTDNGNYIADLTVTAKRTRERLSRPDGQKSFARRVEGIAGVVDHGLFLDLATDVLVARPDGTVETLVRSSR